MSMKNFGLLLLVGGILAVPVAAWIYPHSVADVAVPNVPAVQVPQLTSESESAPAVDAAPPLVEPSCIWGFSKNLCNGHLRGGQWVVTHCGPCVTLVGQDAKLEVRVLHNPDPCSETSIIPCDDTESLIGVLIGKGDYHIRLNGPCPVRGWWQTPWDLIDADGLNLATGWLDGTLGTGTHRVPLCPSPGPVPDRCGDKCELCYMAEFDNSFDPGRWIIHVEGSMVGTVIADQHVYAGCMVRVTMQGFFVAPADSDGLPIPPDQVENGWTFCGTADGVLDCPCE